MSTKILVPVDGSESSMRALQHAIERVAHRDGASIVLLTVHPPLRVYGEIRIYVGEEKMAQMAAQHDRDILEPAEKELQKNKVSFQKESAEGDAAEIIAERAARSGCTEIVMGSRGLGRIGGLMLGSVATKVVHLTQLPVTLIK
jgi:nucleotide-binding universal stress UspA family protein